MIFILACSISLFAKDVAEDGLVEVETPSNLIEVEVPPNPYAGYIERRGSWSLIFDGGYESIALPNYVSPILDTSYQNTFGSAAIGMFRGEVGVKWNFQPVSVSFAASYGSGSVSSSQSGTPTSLNITETSAGVGLWLDSIWSVPYVVPFAKLEAYSIAYNESNDATSAADQTGFAPSYTAGMLINLDFIDPRGSVDGYLEGNLKAFFVSLYLNHRDAGSSSVSFSNGVDYGATLHFEY